MSDTLFGRERSGTPMETRGATRAAAGGIESLLGTGGTGGPLARMESQSLMDLLGFDPSTMGFGEAAESALRDPADVTAGLFASLIPFEEEFVGRQTAEQAGQFGQLGGRFSRNLVDADTRMRSRIGSEFLRTRQEGLLAAGAQRNQALAALLQSVQGAGQVGNQRLQAILQFLNPGAPNWQEGMAGDLLSAGGQAAGAAVLM